MDVIELPLFGATTPLPDALTSMTKSKGSAVMLHEGNDCWLMTPADVMQGFSAKKTTVGQLVRRRWAPVLGEQEAEHEGLNLVKPHATWQGYENYLDDIAASFVVVGIAEQTATVVTRHERYGLDARAGMRTMYCVGPRHHAFPPPSVTVGQRCPYDQHLIVG